MATSKARPITVFDKRKYKKIGDFILKVQAVGLDIANNPTYFATPVPTTATVTTHVATLVTAEATAKTKVVGAAAARDLAYQVVMTDVDNWIGYVQTQADNAVDTSTSIAIINASGLSLKINGVHVKPPLEVTQDSAGIRLVAKAAAKRAAYEWQKSTDNGTTWTSLPSTIEAKTLDTTFTSGTRVLYRFRSVVKAGISLYCNPVSIIVQ